MSRGYLAKCLGKERHATKDEAQEARKSLVAAGKWRMSSSNVYPCNQCGGWHKGRLGRVPRGKSRS